MAMKRFRYEKYRKYPLSCAMYPTLYTWIRNPTKVTTNSMTAESGSRTNSHSGEKSPAVPMPVTKSPTGSHGARCSEKLWCTASAVTLAGSAPSADQFVDHSAAMFHSASRSDSAVDPSATAEITFRRSCSHFHPNTPFTKAPSSGSTGISQSIETAVIALPHVYESASRDTGRIE